MKIYAIIPARSGSKGIIQKNIRSLCGRPLLDYSIAYAKKLPVDKIICSTDSQIFANIAKDLGAEVPFLRSIEAAGDTAMEEDILKDLYDRLPSVGIEIPDIIVWLRPTFVFRSVAVGIRCIQRMLIEKELTACRTVCESESRLYKQDGDLLIGDFDNLGGKSMIRRQDVGTRFKVFSMDVFRGGDSSPFFLGNRVGFERISKICGMDIDDETDWFVTEELVKSASQHIREYVHVCI